MKQIRIRDAIARGSDRDSKPIMAHRPAFAEDHEAEMNYVQTQSGPNIALLQDGASVFVWLEGRELSRL